MEQHLNITQGFSLKSKIDGSTVWKTHRFLYVFWITPSVWWSKILILRKVFHYFQAHVSNKPKEIQWFFNEMPQNHEKSNVFWWFRSSGRLRMPWDHSEAQKSSNRLLFEQTRKAHLRFPEASDFLASCISLLAMPSRRTLYKASRNTTPWSFFRICSYWSGLLLG